MSRLVCFLMLAAFAVSAQSLADDAAIRGVVREYLDARERRDETSLASLFTADVDQLVSSGEWRRGRSSLVEGTLASSSRESGKRVVEIQSIRYLSMDVAIADGRYSIAGEAETRRMWSTFLLKKEAGKWKISAIRNMLPARSQ